jgi:hypothetical protein
MHSDLLKRRDFITLLGGVAAWPLATRAQPSQVARIGALYIGIADAEPFKKPNAPRVRSQRGPRSRRAQGLPS